MTPQGRPGPLQGPPRPLLKTPFRNENRHISAPVKRKSRLTIEFESYRHVLQLVSHWHRQTYHILANKTHDRYMHLYKCAHNIRV